MGPVACTGMFATPWPAALSTFTPTEPVAAEYAPAGGDSVVVASTGAVAPGPAHVTDSFSCISALVPMPPLSHALAVELCATHCSSCVIVNFRPLTNFGV